MTSELAALIAAQPGMASRLLDEHRDDGTGHCRVCTGGAQTGRHRWPCALQAVALAAAELLANRAGY